MDLHPPAPEAYGRVTNPDRYRVVVDAAQSLLRRLVETYDVVQSPGSTTTDFPEYRGPSLDTIRLVPRRGVPLIFALSPFPGVMVRFGNLGQEAFPGCGCDACDEQPDQEIQRMTRLVEAAIDGGYEEDLTRRRLFSSFVGPWGNQRSESRLRRGEWRRYGDRGLRRWPEWPHR